MPRRIDNSTNTPLNLIFIFLLVCFSSVVAMTTDKDTNTITEEPTAIGQCMQLLTPSFQKIFDLEHICRELDRYLACYVYDVRQAATFYPGPLPLDLFHDIQSTYVAYKGVCRDLKAITPNLQCVEHKERELLQCNDQLNAVSTHLENNYYDVETSTQYLCSAFQEHADCESEHFSSCAPDLGHAMKNFYTAALPTTCKIMLGVSSPYDDITFGPLWMGIPMECFPQNSRETDDSSTFSYLCRHQDTFIPCVEKVIEKRNQTGFLHEVSVYDLFDVQSQTRAYKGFCPRVNEFGSDLECVHQTNLTISEQCTMDYNDQIYKMNVDLSFQENKDIMCGATVALLECEQKAYSYCREEIATVYTSYNMAILPDWCKTLTGVTSQFDKTMTTISSTVKTYSATKAMGNGMEKKTERTTLAGVPLIRDNRTPPADWPPYTTVGSQTKIRTNGIFVLVLSLLGLLSAT